MKNHKKYAKLPQDLDLSFQEQLDAVDTAVADDFNLSGSGLDEDDDNILDDQEDEEEEDDEEEDEIVIASAAAAAAGLTGSGVRLASATAAARKQQLNRKVLAGLGRDSVIELLISVVFEAPVCEANLVSALSTKLVGADVNSILNLVFHLKEVKRTLDPIISLLQTLIPILGQVSNVLGLLERLQVL